MNTNVKTEVGNDEPKKKWSVLLTFNIFIYTNWFLRKVGKFSEKQLKRESAICYLFENGVIKRIAKEIISRVITDQLNCI